MKKLSPIFCLLLLCVLLGCQKEEEANLPRFNTNDLMQYWNIQHEDNKVTGTATSPSQYSFGMEFKDDGSGTDFNYTQSLSFSYEIIHEGDLHIIEINTTIPIYYMGGAICGADFICCEDPLYSGATPIGSRQRIERWEIISLDHKRLECVLLD